MIRPTTAVCIISLLAQQVVAAPTNESACKPQSTLDVRILIEDSKDLTRKHGTPFGKVEFKIRAIGENVNVTLYEDGIIIHQWPHSIERFYPVYHLDPQPTTRDYELRVSDGCCTLSAYIEGVEFPRDAEFWGGAPLTSTSSSKTNCNYKGNLLS